MQIDPKKFGKVGVLMGGLSSEREISLMSGQSVMAALQRQNINVHSVDVDQHICQQLIENRFDRVFIALHGSGGEDGVIQGVLETLNIPYTGSDVASSALAMDKQRSKWVWDGIGLPTLPFLTLEDHMDPQHILKTIPLPWAIKPISQGSTLGVSKVTELTQYASAYELAKSYDARVMLEHWVDGNELTVGILDNKALPVIRIVAEGYYDYEAKYFSDVTQYHCPSGLSNTLEKKVQEISLKAYQSLGCRHWGRVDLMMDQAENVWLLEVNTVPGMTDHSLVPKAARLIGLEFDQLVLEILSQTL